MKEPPKIVYCWAPEASNSVDVGGTWKTGKDSMNGMCC